MAQVAVSQRGADARYFARGLRGLQVAQLGEELQRPIEPFGQRRIQRPLLAQVLHIQHLLPRGQQPAQRVRHREGHALPVGLVQLLSLRVDAVQQVFQRPDPQIHG
jgi:hypothetical protein